MVELHPHDMAHGGEAVARKDGKAHFIAGAMPGEVIEASIVEDRGSWARAALVRIIDPSPLRREPPCEYAETCGGCQWQFTDTDTQRSWKTKTVRDQLEHLGRLRSPLVHKAVSVGPDLGYRNRMDFHVVDGLPGLYRSSSHDIVHLEHCPLLVPELQDLYSSVGDLEGVTRLTLRAGTRTGDTLVILEGDVPDGVGSWGAPVAHRSGGRIKAVHGDPALSEVVSGVTFDIPVDGFFQSNTPGADTLVDLVTEALDVRDDETMLDGYCGVGLFGATVGRSAGRVIGLESSANAVAAARGNLSRAGVDHKVVTGSFTRDIESLDEYWDVAVVDPPRRGLGQKGVDAVTSTMPRRIVYVACDPASLARDSKLLVAHGYEYVEATPVDLFPQTYHIETVARFDRVDT